MTFACDSRVAETLPEEVLQKMYAPPKPDYPVVKPTDLLKHDGILFGVATRYAGWPAQLKVWGFLVFFPEVSEYLTVSIIDFHRLFGSTLG